MRNEIKDYVWKCDVTARSQVETFLLSFVSDAFCHHHSGLVDKIYTSEHCWNNSSHTIVGQYQSTAGKLSENIRVGFAFVIWGPIHDELDITSEKEVYRNLRRGLFGRKCWEIYESSNYLNLNKYR